MFRGPALLSSPGWAVAYALAVQLGSVSAFPGATLAVVWPACGVAVLWLLGRGDGDLVLQVVLLTAVALGVHLLNGGTLGISAWLALVNAAQGVTGALLLRRLCPELWGCGGTATFDGVGRVFRLLLAAVVSSLVAMAMAAVGLWWLAAQPTVVDLGIHWGRNVYGCLAVVSLVHLVGHGWRFRDPGRPVLPRSRLPELTLLAAVTLVVCSIAFLQSSLPVAYAPAVVVIWAGLRFTPAVVAVHVTIAGVFALAATMAGLGPYALVTDLPQRALLIQLLIVVLTLEGLSIAAVRHQQRSLLREATSQTALLSTIMDSMQPGVVVLDRLGRPAGNNQPATALLAMDPAVPGPAGGPAAGGRPRIDAWTSVWARLAEQEAPTQLDLRLDGPDGALTVEVRPTPMLEGGVRVGTVVLLTDVTAERTAREGLTAFAGTVAHDLRGPLTRVTGWSQALADELAGGDPDLELASAMVDRVGTAAAHMDDLIDDLLAHAVSRDGALEPTSVPVDRVALQVAETLGAEGHVVVRERAEAHADPGLVRHLVTNLLSNSLKYVAPGTVPRVSIRARPMGEMVEVRVCDNGIGIPEDERVRVFEQFHRVAEDYPGTGLGLAICRTIVERHGGEIHAEGNEVGGTCMVLTLPAPPRTPSRAETASRVETPNQAGPADRERLRDGPLPTGRARGASAR